jgi:uncharacterized phage protein (TIGR01671 family)
MEILIRYRAITINGDVVFGLLSKKGKDWFISNSADKPFAFHVRPETICQFTGIFDKNSNPIYKGDILKHDSINSEYSYKNYNNGLVIWAKVRAAFAIEILSHQFNTKTYEDLCSCNIDGRVDVETMTDYRMEVLGNIFQNPELL